MASCKYYKQVRQVSYDSGVTWISLDEFQKGDLYETDSPDCGGGITQYRWVNVSGQYTCVGTTKYQKTKKQQSTDGGQTWTDVNPPEYSTGAVIEYNSQDCIGGNVKLSMTYSNGQTYSKNCDSNSTLTSGETRPNGYVYTAITSAVIGDCVTSISSRTFSGCYNLKSINIPNSVTSIGTEAFYNCSSLTSITIPTSVTSISDKTFYSCGNLTSINIPNSVTTIGKNAFRFCSSLTSCTIGSSVTTIGVSAFEDCNNLKSINIPNSVTSIGMGAFSNCRSLTSITIPTGVTSISDTVFNNCSGLTSIGIPNSVTSIEIGAFYGCTSLTSITIPSGVTSIGDYGFQDCSGLTSVTVLATTPPTLGNSSVFGNTNNCPIYVPSGSVNTYKAASKWSNYASRIQAIP